jgi:hypothetical protein
MATRAANHGSRSFDISLAILVLASTSATLGILGLVSYRIGLAENTELRFFGTGTRPNVDWATAACPVEYALRTTDTNDIVFLGDSTCRTGLDPARFERATGLAAYNLGSLRGIGPNGFVITAKAYLIHHAKPRAFVLCVTPTCFEIEAGTLAGPLPKEFAANYGPEVSEVVPLVGRISYFCRCGVSTFWKPVGWTEKEVRGRDVRDVPLRGLKTETYRTLQSKTRDARGFFNLPGKHGPPKGVGRAEKILIHPKWDEGIRRLAQICEEAGVRLVIQFAPISADVAKARDFASLETWSRELESTYSHTSVARPIVLVYDAPLMWDAYHLNTAGVEAFVPVVAKEVRTALQR